MMNTGVTAPSQIHETALIDATAEIGEGVTIGPYSVIGPRVKLGDGVPHLVQLERPDDRSDDLHDVHVAMQRALLVSMA